MNAYENSAITEQLLENSHQEEWVEWARCLVFINIQKCLQQVSMELRMPQQILLIWTCTKSHRISWISSKLSSQCTSTSLEAWAISGRRQWHTRDWYIKGTIDWGSHSGSDLTWSIAHVVDTLCWSVGPEVGLDYYFVFSCYLFSTIANYDVQQKCKCHQLSNTYTTHSHSNTYTHIYYYTFTLSCTMYNGLQHMPMTYQ